MRDYAGADYVAVMLVEPHPLTLAGLRAVLQAQPDIAVVGETGSGRQAIRQVGPLNPDVVVLDCRLHDACGLEVIRLLRQRCPRPRVVVFTDEDEPRAIRAVLAAGASAYLLKSATAEEVVQAVRAASRGQRFLQGEIVHRLTSLVHWPAMAENLSPRELEVLTHVALGESNDDIARCLHLAVKTVEMHVGNVLAKLDVRSRTQAALLAVNSGLVAFPPSLEAVDDPALGALAPAGPGPIVTVRAQKPKLPNKPNPAPADPGPAVTVRARQDVRKRDKVGDGWTGLADDETRRGLGPLPIPASRLRPPMDLAGDAREEAKAITLGSHPSS